MNSKSWTVSQSLLSAVDEMAEGENDELSIDAFDMMLFMADCGTDSPHGQLLEDFEPEAPQDLSGNSISPPILTVPSLDSDELVSSLPHIPNIARCELLPQTLECKDDFWVTNSASPQEDLSPELAKSSHVSPLIIRDLEEEDNRNYAASKRSYSHNTSQYDEELQYSLHKRMKRAVSPTRNQEKRRIWGVSSTYAAKKPSMDVGPDINPRVLTSTSEAGSKRDTSMSIPSSQVVCLDLDNSDAMEDGGGRSNKKTMSRNLVSERHRRHKLNEKLYSLRALVPNISKMDKASIVADAVSYVRDLKRQEKVMQREVSHLAAARDALASGLLFNSKVCFPSKFDSTHDRPTPQHRRHQVVKFIMTHLEDRIYELQICCKRSIGLWLQLTQAIEALGYDTISANFSHINDHIFNNLIIEVQKEQVLSQEELCDKTMKAMLRFGFIFDIQKIKLEDIM